MSPRFKRPVDHRFPELAPADGYDDEEEETLFDLDEVEQELDPITETEKALLASVLAKTSDALKAKPPVVKPEAPEKSEDQGFRGWTLPGFEGKARVCTSFGDLPIEALRRRDLVKTISGAYREVQWVDAIHLDVDFLQRHHQALPVMLRAKSLGGGFPVRNMLVSPAQDLWEQSASGYCRRRASDLLDRPGIMRQHRSEITYYRFHCGSPEKVCIEGSYFDISPPV